MKKSLGIFMAFVIGMYALIIYLKPIYAVPKGSAVDNTNHGWEVKRNKEHKRPDIPKVAAEMVEKYGVIYAGDPNKKVVYLTIDLGYENGSTEKVLDVLKENEVKATFFIVSSYLKKNIETVDRIVKEGHSLQNHTSNYKHLYTLRDEDIKKEIMDMHCEVERRYGISMKYLRPPYEEWSERTMNIAVNLGYKPVFWSVACMDWVENKSADYIYTSVMDNYHNGAVILLHTVSRESPRAVDMIIKGLKAKGYDFSVLDM